MDEFLFTEKYRPSTIDECILPDRIKKLFKSYKRKKNMVNLLLSGGTGTGKTSVACAMLKEMGVPHIMINRIFV